MFETDQPNEQLVGPLETLDADGAKGEFKAYGAIFGNQDDWGDIIEKGAFTKMRKKKNGAIRVPLYHDTRMIVGEAFVEQDSKGLKVKGQLNMELSYAPDAFLLMKDGSLDSMSVGFNILKGGSEWSEDYSTRKISKAELWEVSIVPFPMNRKAKISNVKSAGGLASVRDFETFLKKHGFSNSEAVGIASRGFNAYLSESDALHSLSESGIDNAAIALAVKSAFATHFPNSQ